MRFYLRVINPIIALLVFLLCCWAAMNTESEFDFYGIVIGGFGSYFFAKGLFTSGSLLIVGRILLEMFYHSDTKTEKKYSRKEITYTLSFAVFTIGSLIGLYLLSDDELFSKEVKTISEQNPKEIIVSKIHRVTESDDLRYTLQLNNESLNLWDTIAINCKLYIDGNYSDKEIV